jgi:sulfur-oxidizing protein SoxA
MTRLALKQLRARCVASAQREGVRRWLLAVALGAAVTSPVVWAQTPKSGFDFMSAQLQAMQNDEANNPGMLWVRQGLALWHSSAGVTASCASCHAQPERMRGVATRYPAFSEAVQRPVNLGQRINQCRERQGAGAFKLESRELLSLETLVAYQSRGMPITPPDDPRLTPFVEQGRERYMQRMGQLNLSCAQCHDQRAGQRLGGNTIPTAHPTGYPIYRLEWNGVGGLQRRLRNCMSGVRAQPYPLGDLALVELELYLARQAQGMALETPGVRP